MARRCGANCSARSGAALSWTTGLRVSVSAHASPLVGLLFPPLRSVLIKAEVGLVLAIMMMMAGCSGGTVLVDSAVDMANHSHAAMVRDAATVVPFNLAHAQLGSACSIASAMILSNVSLPLVRRFVWPGFEWDHTLGYDGEGPPDGEGSLDHVEFDNGTILWLEQMEEELRLLEALPVVQRVDLNYHDTDPNLNYVKATLWCCWEGNRFKRVKESTDQTGKKPTHLEAARELRAKLVAKHCCEAHRHHPRAVARREQLART